MLRSFNNTWLTFIPKVDNMRQLRPINSCQFVYKIIAKICLNDWLGSSPEIILPGQNAFIRERRIVDNVLIGHELMHYLKIKTRGKKGNMALKVGMKKAYDRAE
ncbi:unnamed protein product [Linum trigynum]|uniref:Reverse transcriptase domain-containing protein n=1 Tax=Linum trigynum TaxID=586398 RepID=A0AAV2EDN1_9ROSI